MARDRIRIHRLRAATRIGVTDDERAEAQEVEICVRMTPNDGLAGLGDQIDKTVDYFVAAQRVRQLAASGERKLIETLAEDIAAALLAEFPLAEARVEVRKFILPQTEFVSVTVALRA